MHDNDGYYGTITLYIPFKSINELGIKNGVFTILTEGHLIRIITDTDYDVIEVDNARHFEIPIDGYTRFKSLYTINKIIEITIEFKRQG